MRRKCINWEIASFLSICSFLCFIEDFFFFDQCHGSSKVIKGPRAVELIARVHGIGTTPALRMVAFLNFDSAT